MRLYHGSKSGITGTISPRHSRETCDFGTGFYMGDIPKQPMGLIASYPTGVFYEIDYDMSGLHVKSFGNTYDDLIDWALYIAYHRTPNVFKDYPHLSAKYYLYDKQYDVIVGLIADDSMINTLNNFFDGIAPDKEMLACLKHVKLGNQYVLKSEDACGDRIKILSERSLTSHEINAEISHLSQRRGQMDSILKTYHTMYRKDSTARYIDEIMEDMANGIHTF